MGKIIVTSALPYINAMPHLGNFVGSILPADVYYKYLMMKGADAIFICGSDEHGTPIELSAIKKGIPPKQYAAQMHKEVKEAVEAFGCTFTLYGETNSESNMEVTYEIFDALNKNGYILEVEDIQPYCGIDKRFIADRFIEGTCPYCKKNNARGDQCDDCGKLLEPQQLINPYCNICGNKKIEFKKTKNLALNLKKLQPKIEKFVRENSATWTKNSVNKTLSYLEQGLKPRDITRDFKWGFPVKAKGFEDKVFYVWFDALIGYIGITRAWNPNAVKEYWMGKDTRLIHFMGKDNIEFHTMVWPGVLFGSNLGYVMPDSIIAYEFLMWEGKKFSKSRGIGMDIKEATSVIPADYWRFILMYLLPETGDADFSIALADEIINKVMNGKIGNLIHRALTIAKKNESLLKEIKVSERYEKRVNAKLDSYADYFEKIKLREAVKCIVELADMGNEIMSNEKPWELIGTDNEKFADIIGTVLRIAYDVSIMLWPFTPSASSKALEYFNLDRKPMLKDLDKKVSLNKEKPLLPIFNKMTDAELKKLEKFSGD